jgi:D-inositol-3-phosphate glycosyltransferase
MTGSQQKPEVTVRHPIRGGVGPNGAQGKPLPVPSPAPRPRSTDGCAPPSTIAVLTAGRDKPYALGLASALMAQGLAFDFIGSDAVDSPELHGNPQVNYLNLRNQRADAGLLQKMARVMVYYCRLIYYAATTRAGVFHILWNNKFELFDRTLLMLYYKLLGKKIVFTAHNVNAGARDEDDSSVNRLSLKIQYGLSDHIFTHTQKMKAELVAQFGVDDGKISVIPFGINNTVPNTELTSSLARQRLGIREDEKVLLFFGNIAPYKGLEYLVRAFVELAGESEAYRLIVVGKPKGCEDYWRGIEQTIRAGGIAGRVIQRIEYVPDGETEWFFKAADVLVLPYVEIFQSGVLFLGYSFGLPVIAADVGSLKDEIIEHRTGLVFEAKNPAALARTVRTYFTSELYRNLAQNRPAIRDYANDRYSWAKVGEVTKRVYLNLLAR